MIYDSVEPLDYDLIVYRGVRFANFATNFFNGKCVIVPETTYYECPQHEIVNVNYFKYYDPVQHNAQDFVYEIMGLCSTTTSFGKAVDFGYDIKPKNKIIDECQVVMALRLPAGTKFFYL